MYIKMSDFFMGMGKEFTVEVLDIPKSCLKKKVIYCFTRGIRPPIFMFCSKAESSSVWGIPDL